MGQLVNKERLHETLAKLKLSEEIRKNETMEEERKAQEEIERRKQEVKAKKKAAAAKASSKTSRLSNENGSQNSDQRKKESSRLLSIFKNRSSDALDVGPSVSSGQMKGSFDEEGSKATRRWLRHTRGKSLSDGVQFMTTNACLQGDILSSGSSSPTGSSRLSAAAAEQLRSTDDEPAQLDGSQDDALARPIHSRRRHPRKKSISDSVALMRSVNNTTDPFALEKTVPHEENDLQKRVNVDMPKDLGQRTPMRSICEKGADNGVSKQPEQSLGKVERKQRRRLMKAQSEGVAMMRMSIATEPKRSSLENMAKGNKPNTLITLSELTQLSTKVRTSIINADFITSLTPMNACTHEISTTDPKDLPEIPEFSQKSRPRRRPRAKSASEGVAMMRAGLIDNASSSDDIMVANIRKQETKDAANERSRPTLLTERSEPALSSKLERKQRRRLMKAQSEGVTLMRTSLATEPKRLSLDTVEEKAEKLATLSELTHVSTKVYCI